MADVEKTSKAPSVFKEKEVIENIKFIFDGDNGLECGYTFYLKLTNFRDVKISCEYTRKPKDMDSKTLDLFDGLNYEDVKVIHNVFGQIIDMVENSTLEEKITKSKNPTVIQLSFELPLTRKEIADKNLNN